MLIQNALLSAGVIIGGVIWGWRQWARRNGAVDPAEARLVAVLAEHARILGQISERLLLHDGRAETAIGQVLGTQATLASAIAAMASSVAVLLDRTRRD